MIHFSLTVTNPFFKSGFKSLFCLTKELSKNKTLEIEGCFWKYNLLAFSLDTQFRGTDHAGPQAMIGLFGLELSIKVSDNRHWDYDNNCWQEADSGV